MVTAGGAEPSDPRQIAELIVQHHADAIRVARRLVRSESEAEDLVQTATLNALRRADHIEDQSHVKAYLLTSVRNLWRNQLRQQGTRRFIGADAAEFIPAPELGPEEQALTDLDAALARRAFADLSQTSREILFLRYVDGLTYTDLAEHLGISAVAARQRAHRAREELIGSCIEQTALTGAGSCGSVRARLGRYLRGRLTRRARGQISGHLSRCASCQECFRQLTDLYGHRLPQDDGR